MAYRDGTHSVQTSFNVSIIPTLNRRNTYLIATLTCVLLAIGSYRRAPYSRSMYENCISFVIIPKLEPETDQIRIRLVVL